jgi:hypothetical protein
MSQGKGRKETGNAVRVWEDVDGDEEEEEL